MPNGQDGLHGCMFKQCGRSTYGELCSRHQRLRQYAEAIAMMAEVEWALPVINWVDVLDAIDRTLRQGRSLEWSRE